MWESWTTTFLIVPLLLSNVIIFVLITNKKERQINLCYNSKLPLAYYQN